MLQLYEKLLYEMAAFTKICTKIIALWLTMVANALKRR
jgi:hypothetical protein